MRGQRGEGGFEYRTAGEEHKKVFRRRGAEVIILFHLRAMAGAEYVRLPMDYQQELGVGKTGLFHRDGRKTGRAIVTLRLAQRNELSNRSQLAEESLFQR